MRDNVAVRTSLSDFLTLKGHSVSEVGDAVELYQQLAIQSFDVAVVDVNLPHHNGFSITEYLSEKDLCAVIIMTARDAVEDRCARLLVWCRYLYVKPVEPEELAAAITSLTQKQRQGTSPLKKWQMTTGNLKQKAVSFEPPVGALFL